MKIEIKHRITGSTLFEVEAGSLKAALEIAVGMGANLRGADLRDANLRGADLRGADLRGADLCDADLRGADLCDADLRGADLRDANLRGADLWGADLRGANLRGADLRDANLWGADLRGADLRGAKNAPTIITGWSYDVMITSEQIRIGCKIHTKKEWENFTDKEIHKMDGEAADKFWAKYKEIIMALAKQHSKE